jgi:EAL domain-containing protein (putative c-di-GMP-specific phosphodiesterase class I)
MGARLIAEGIETGDEFRIMKALNVPMSQGYYLGHPQPAGHWAAAGCTIPEGLEAR